MEHTQNYREHMENPQPETIKLDTNEMMFLSKYICTYNDIFIVNDRHMDLNICFTWHLNELYTRLGHAIIKAWTKTPLHYREKQYKFKINHVEKRILSILFAMYPCDEPFFIITQEKLIKGLIKIGNPNQITNTCKSIAMN